MNESNEADRIYKSSPEFAYAVKEEPFEINDELRKELLKFKDPVVLGMMIYKMKEERENTNRIMKTLLARLDSLQARLEQLETPASPQNIGKSKLTLIPKIDEEIVAFVRKKRNACAEDVQRHFRYRGKNAASARLNKLFELGLLEKRQVGRTVYYLPK
ncbi:MAG: hypothetical protein NT157_02555 [Candidatus Micrarchaeota archaeon]|nr:hypothetical protein [Candidatus Micrarchaeota archaeon]